MTSYLLSPFIPFLMLSSFSNGKKESTNRNENVGMQKGANFTVVSTILLIAFNSKLYEIFAKQLVN